MGRTGNDRGGSWWRALATAPWRRAPLLLRSQPAVLSAVLFAGLILGAAAAAVRLFESSVASAADAKQIAQRCPATVGFVLTTAGVPSGRIGGNDAPGAAGLAATTLLDRREAAVERVAARVPNVGAPLLTITGTPLIMSNPGDQSRSANGRLLYREGFADHIQKLQVAGGGGVWLPSETAGFAGVHAGGRVALTIKRPQGRRQGGRDLQGPEPRAGFGPSELLDASAPRAALSRVGIALAGGLLLGGVAALRSRACGPRAAVSWSPPTTRRWSAPPARSSRSTTGRSSRRWRGG